MHVGECVAVLQAGGKGTRMRELTGDTIPKPLLQLGGRPMLEWQVLNLRKYGITEFVIIVGYLGEQIQAYFGDGSCLDVHIRYIVEKEPLGSGGALSFLKDMMNGVKHILLTLGDVMFDIDVDKFVAFHVQVSAAATLLVHPNSHPRDSDLVVLEETDVHPEQAVSLPLGGRIKYFDAKTNLRDYYYDNCVNAGLYLLEPYVITALGEATPCDLEKDILLPYLKRGKLYGYRTTEYVKDAGTPERYKTVERELAHGIWLARNLCQQQRAIFFDRDGTLNVYRGLIGKAEEFDLLSHTAEAIRQVNSSGFLALVVSNQPAVARGMCSVADVRDIHRKMGVLLGEDGAFVDDIIFCPHHPDKGYPEENVVYKFDCSCRKPKTGMINFLVERYNIDCSQSWFVGDSVRDIECGKRAGLRTIWVATGEVWPDNCSDISPDFRAVDVLAAVRYILDMS